MIKNHSKKNSDGFTLVELLLATALFAFILLFAVSGFVQITRAYNKGVTVKRMHDSARRITDEIATAIIEATGSDSLVYNNDFSGGGYICIKDRIQFRWVEKEVDRSISGTFSLVRRTQHTESCGSGSIIPNMFPGTNSAYVTMTDPLVGVKDIRLDSLGGGAYRLTVELATNSSDTAWDNPQPCAPRDTYCDFVTLNTIVSLRSE